MQVLKDLEDNSIDSVVSDPPYGLSQISTQVFNECMFKWCTDDRSFMPSSKGFMGKSWDSFVPPPSLWDEVYRVLKPGGHALIFAGSRTQDLMGLSLRLAGFEMRDCIQWIYGSGFPKSLDVSKAIDKLKGEERKIVGKGRNFGASKLKDGKTSFGDYAGEWNVTTPSPKEAKEWEGWGTALKPAYEPALLVRKPFRGSVAQNVLEYGVGGINVDGGRIDTNDLLGRSSGGWGEKAVGATNYGLFNSIGITKEGGRWPSNVLLHESIQEEWAKYFYCAKASREERERGLYGFSPKDSSEITGRKKGSEGLVMKHPDGTLKANPYAGTTGQQPRSNIHPTVKPIDLMRYLCRLITPPGGTTLDPFMGSGSTGIGAIKEGFDFIGIEREEEYFEIAKARIEYWTSIDLSYEDNQEKSVDSQLSLFG